MATIERAKSRLGFTFHLAPHGGQLTLKPRRWAGWLTVEALELSVPNLALPVDLSTGADKFQRRRTEASRLVLAMAPRDLDELALSREIALANLGVTAARLRLRHEHATVWAQLRNAEDAGEVCFKVYPLASGGGVRLLVTDARALGALATPAAIIAHRIACALTSATTSSDDPGAAIAQGLGDITIDAAAGVLWKILPPAGWRLPDTARLSAESIAISDEGGRVAFARGAGERQGSPRARELAAITAALSSADGCLLAGDLQGALRAYREVMQTGDAAAQTATWRAIDVARAVAVGDKRPGATELATELCRDAMDAFPDAAAPRATLAGLAASRRDLASVAELCAEVADIDARAGDIDAALVTALFAARACASTNPETAQSLYERALGLEPGCPEATTALADHYQEAGKWADLARILRARAAAAPSPEARAREHIRLAEILADRLGDPAAAQAELSRAQDACPESPAALDAAATLAAGAGDTNAAREMLLRSVALSEAQGDPAAAARALCRLAEILATIDLVGAREAIDKALAAAPEDPAVLRVAARVASADGNHATAASHLQTALRVGGGQGSSRDLVDLARALVLSGDAEAAKPVIERALASGDPEAQAGARAANAELLAQSGDTDGARSALSAAAEELCALAESHDDHARLRDRAAALFLRRAELGSDDADADANYQRAAELSRTGDVKSRAATALADSAQARGDRSAETRWLGVLLDAGLRGKRRAQCLLRRARLALEGGAIETAAADIEAVLEANATVDQRAEALLILAESRGHTGDVADRARILAERAELNLPGPDRVAALVAAATAHLDAKDSHRALLLAQRADDELHELSPTDGDASRDQVLTALGEASWRRRAWNEVLRAYTPLVSSGAGDSAHDRALFAHRLGVAMETAGQDLDGAAAAMNRAVAEIDAPAELRTASFRALADIHERAGHGEKAAATLERLASDPRVQANPHARAEAWYRAGELRRRDERFGDAERCFEAALAVERDHMPALDALERLKAAAGDNERVAVILGRKIAAMSGHPERQKALLIRLGCLERDTLGRLDVAREAFGRALEIDPEFVEAQAELQKLPSVESRTPTVETPPLIVDDDRAEPEPVASVEAAAEPEADGDPEAKAPASIDATLRVAAALEERDQIDAAVAHYRAAADEAPDDRRPLEALERLHAQRGDADALTETLGRMILATDDSAERARLWYRRGKLYRDTLHREAEAYRCFKEAHANAPAHGAIAHALRAIAMVRGEWALAAELIYREIGAAESATEAGALYFELALIYEQKLLDPEQAVVTYEQALGLDPDIPAAPQPLARLYELFGRDEEAARTYEQAADHTARARERSRFLGRAAACAQRAGQGEYARRLANLAESAMAQPKDSGATHDIEGVQAEILALERELAAATDEARRADLAKSILALAVDGADADAALRHAGGLAEKLGPDAPALAELCARARARGGDAWPVLAALLNARADACRDPQDRAEMLVEVGNILGTHVGDAHGTRAAFERALDADPDHPGAIEALAKLAYERADWHSARELYARLPADQSSLAADVLAYRRGEIAEVLGRDREAHDCFAEAAAENPASTESLSAVARTAVRIGELDVAIGATRSLLDLVPLSDPQSIVSMRLSLADLCRQAGHVDTAIDYYELVLAEEPASRPALSALVELFTVRGEPDRATQCLRELIAQTQAPDEKSQLFYLLGETYRTEMGDAELSADAYIKCVDLDPGHVPALRRLIHYYWRIADTAGVMDIARDLHRRGALIVGDTGHAALARVAIAATMSGDPDLGAEILGHLGKAAAREIAAALIETAERPGISEAALHDAARALTSHEVLTAADLAAELRGREDSAPARSLAAALY